MSTFTLNRNRADLVLTGSGALGLRPPSEITGSGPPQLQTERTLVYTPDLSPAELALFNRLAANDIQDDLQALRSFRQLGRNAFIQLGQDARDRLLYDTLVAQIIVTLNLTREE